MKRAFGQLLACAAVMGCATAQPELAPRTPPTVKAARTYPRLVNYFHMMDLPDAQAPDREALLAQWDLIVLDPELVERQRLSLERIRSVNPGIVILAWVPFGQESGYPAMLSGFRDLADFYVTSAGGRPLVPPWGGHMMNPWRADFAWTKHVIGYAEASLLSPGMYDGILFDCLSEDPPAWATSDGTADVNGDGRFDDRDAAAWQEGVTHLLRTLRERRPDAILVGNGGVPWSDRAPYLAFANGDMAENAFGDEFGPENATFERQWTGYRTAMARAEPPLRYLLVADLRMNRTLAQSQRASGLGPEDQRRFRLALTTTLLGDGYFGFDRGDCLHGQLWWFDEYDVDLGPPLETYQSDVYGRGTLSREYANGTVVVNPTGRAVRVSFPAARTDVSGRVTATAFDVPPSDGRMYLR